MGRVWVVGGTDAPPAHVLQSMADGHLLVELPRSSNSLCNSSLPSFSSRPRVRRLPVLPSNEVSCGVAPELAPKNRARTSGTTHQALSRNG